MFTFRYTLSEICRFYLFVKLNVGYCALVANNHQIIFAI